MFERFTERARQVVVLAQEEARALRHSHIGTEHLLLGLLREEEGLGARVLESHGVNVDNVRAKVVELTGEGQESPSGQIPFTPRAKLILEGSLREALAFGHNYIGTEHILLSAVHRDEGMHARILLDIVGDNYEQQIRNEVMRMLGGTKKRDALLEAAERAVYPPKIEAVDLDDPEPTHQLQTFGRAPLGDEEQLIIGGWQERYLEQVVVVEDRHGVECFVFSARRGQNYVVRAQEHVDMLLELLGRHRSRRGSQGV